MAAHSTDGSAGTTPSTAPAQAAVDPAEFAEYLRAERERRRLTLDQVADETKIAQRHLAASLAKAACWRASENARRKFNSVDAEAVIV